MDIVRSGLPLLDSCTRLDSQCTQCCLCLAPWFRTSPRDTSFALQPRSRNPWGTSFGNLCPNHSFQGTNNRRDMESNLRNPTRKTFCADKPLYSHLQYLCSQCGTRGAPDCSKRYPLWSRIRQDMQCKSPDLHSHRFHPRTSLAHLTRQRSGDPRDMERT